MRAGTFFIRRTMASANVFRASADGKTIYVVSRETFVTHETLPVGVYIVNQDRDGEFFLAASDPFKLPPKIYSDVPQRATRILTTFSDRRSSTGVLLSGFKGSGKTLLAKYIIATSGLPALIVNSPFCGDRFSAFLEKIKQPTIVLFDEFEKVYLGENQTDLLTVFDGVFQSKKLFIATCNYTGAINDGFINRPGRFFYSICYTGLAEDHIRDYAMDVLVDKSRVDEIVRFLRFFNVTNFDMLQAIVEEMNRFNCSLKEAMKMLNVDFNPEHLRTMWKFVSVKKDGVEFEKVGSEFLSGKLTGLEDTIAVETVDASLNQTCKIKFAYGNYSLKPVSDSPDAFHIHHVDGWDIIIERTRKHAFMEEILSHGGLEISENYKNPKKRLTSSTEVVGPEIPDDVLGDLRSSDMDRAIPDDVLGDLRTANVGRTILDNPVSFTVLGIVNGDD